MSITKRMQRIAADYEAGVPVEVIAKQYNISEGSVLKKIKSITHHKSSNPLKARVAKRWNEENIKQGIDRYIAENGNLPSAQDFDETPYLPSARQIQRAYGGVVALRKTLGYGEADFTKGELRKKIATDANKRGITAEDYFEPLLIERFGEPYVHTQKRYYKGSKNRYDFLIYAANQTLGIDIFTTDRISYIGKNIRHKIKRYKNAPSQLKIYFVLVGKEFTAADIQKARSGISELKQYPNMIPLHESEFLRLIATLKPLGVPSSFLSLSELEDSASYI